MKVHDGLFETVKSKMAIGAAMYALLNLPHHRGIFLQAGL